MKWKISFVQKIKAAGALLVVFLLGAGHQCDGQQSLCCSTRNPDYRVCRSASGQRSHLQNLSTA